MSNIEILNANANANECEVGSNLVLYEHAVQATGHLRPWAGRATHHLRRTPDGLRTAAKKVELVNSTSPLPNLPFII